MKVNAMPEYKKYCTIALDEMAITASNIFNSSSNHFVRDVSVPHHSGSALLGLKNIVSFFY